MTPHDDRSRQADRHQVPEPDQAQPRDALPRDTVREVRDNTLRGLQPGPEDQPASSRPSPVVVPSQDDPEPLPADLDPAAPEPDPTQSTKPRRTGPAPHLKAALTTVPPGWFNPPGVGNKSEYSAPQAAPETTDHKTIETATVKLDPEVDPRKQITERKLKRPPTQSEPPTQTLATVRPSRRPIAVALVIGLAAVVVGIGLGLHSHAERQAKAAPDAPSVGGAKVTAPSRPASVAAPIAPGAAPTASVEPPSLGSTQSAPAAAPSAAATQKTATVHHAMPAHAAPRRTPQVASKPKAPVRHPGKQPAGTTPTAKPVAPAAPASGTGPSIQPDVRF